MKNIEECANGRIETINRILFNPFDPEVIINDVAHGLKHTCRFNGHITRFYDVGSHSVMVAEIMEYLELGDPMEGLLHDAAEAYIGDLPAPFKPFCPGFVAMEESIERVVREAWDLPPVKSVGCKEADWLALFIEAKALTPNKGMNIVDVYGIRRKAWDFPLLPWYPK